MTKFLRTPFLYNTFWRLLLKLVEYLFLEVFFVSLEKSLLLYCRCLISKFSEILLLSCRKIFSPFYLICMELFPIAVISLLCCDFPLSCDFPLISFFSSPSTLWLGNIFVQSWLEYCNICRFSLICLESLSFL